MRWDRVHWAREGLSALGILHIGVASLATGAVVDADLQTIPFNEMLGAAGAGDRMEQTEVEVMSNTPEVEVMSSTKEKKPSPRPGKSRKTDKAEKLEPLGRKVYEKELEKLHVELVKLQQWVVKEGLKVCVVFEGRDGAGKGGAIKAITERVSPRIFRVVALPAPTEREKSQMYVQRYIPHMPAAGEIVIFDRSWYNRAGVERVMGFCEMNQVERFLKIVPAVEKTLIDSGILLIKYWLEVSPEEQTRRLEARIKDGRKIWKLSPMDLKSYSRWYDYSRARDDMFAATDTRFAPWYVVRSDDKRRARLNLITHLLAQIPYKSELPKRQKRGDYREPKHPFKFIKEVY
jgi:polyphosphate kinase 2